GDGLDIQFWLDGVQVYATEILFQEINTWTTIPYDGAADRVTFQGFGVAYHPYGVDNIRFMPRVQCYPDFDANGSLDLFDFLAFVNAFNAADPRADCDQNGVFDLFDFLCFVNAFNAGC